MLQFSITTTTTTTTTMTTTITTTLTTTTHYFSSLVFSYLILFCSLIFSYPLYFSYFIFFFPYLLKLFSFLSPLFITTSLFLLVFLTYHNNSCLQNPESKVGILLNSYQVLNTLCGNLDEENVQNFQLLEDLEACMLVLDGDNQNYLHFVEKPGEFKELELNAQGKTGEFLNVEEKAGELKELVISQEEKTREFEEVTLDVAEKAGKSKELSVNVEVEVEVKPGDFEEEQEDEFQDVADVLGDKPGEFQELAVTVPQETGDSTQHSSLHVVSHSSTTPELTSKLPVEEFSLTKKPLNNYKEKLITQQQPPPLKKYEMFCSATIEPTLSMRKEKEWRRTLACKLYEERQNSEGSEGMDLLWEEYEVDTAKAKKRNVKKETGYENEEEDDEEVHVKLCCLQALKMSTGKMNLGMKKPNLVKFSKALKGIGWLHHHVSSKYGNNSVKSA